MKNFERGQKHISNKELEIINNYFKKFDNKTIPYALCEKCYKTNNLIICDVCKNYYHLKVILFKFIVISVYL
jgi:hypothetical protein